MTAPSTSPRLLIVTPWSPQRIGGIERHVREVSVRFAAAGLSVQVLCGAPGAKAPADQVVDGVHIRELPALPAERDWMFVPRLWSEIRDAGADLVHLQSYHTAMAPMAMTRARSLGLPYLLTFHGGGSSIGYRDRLRASQRRLQRGLYAGAARLIATADFEIQQYSRECGIGTEHFIFIPNGVDIRPDPTASSDPAPPVERDREVHIASIGRLEQYKGHHRAIATLPALLAARPQAHLHIVGAGPYEPELRALAAASEAAERIHFTVVPAGDGAAMARLLTQMDLVLLLSEFETHPLTALEAASMRRRLVVADVNGLGELAARGFGRGVSLDLSPALVAGVVDQELAKPGPVEVLEPFSWDDCAEALLRLYTETLAR